MKMIEFIVGFLGESRKAGSLRRLFVLFILISVVLLSALFFTIAGQFPQILFSFRGLRYWIFPLAALIGAMLIIANYIRRIYQLPNTRLAFRYFLGIAFGLGLPSLDIREGKINKGGEDVNLLEWIG
jgi:hypothetical protein